MKKLNILHVVVLFLLIMCISGCGNYKPSSGLAIGDMEVGMTTSELKSLDHGLKKISNGNDEDNAKFQNPKAGITVITQDGKVRVIQLSFLYGNKPEKQSEYRGEQSDLKTPLGISTSDSIIELKNKYGTPIKISKSKVSTSYDYRIEKKDGGYGVLRFKVDENNNSIVGIEAIADDWYNNNSESVKADVSTKIEDNNKDKNDKSVSQASASDKLSLGGVSLKSNESEIKSILGTPLSIESKGDGITVQKFKDVEVHFANDRIQMIVSNSPNAKTSRGIHEQSSIHDAVKEYGGNYVSSSYGNFDLVEYKVNDSSIGECIIRFASDKSTNKVSYISIRRGE